MADNEHNIKNLPPPPNRKIIHAEMVSNLSFYFYVFQLLTKNLHVADLMDLLATPL